MFTAFSFQSRHAKSRDIFVEGKQFEELLAIVTRTNVHRSFSLAFLHRLAKFRDGKLTTFISDDQLVD